MLKFGGEIIVRSPSLFASPTDGGTVLDGVFRELGISTFGCLEKKMGEVPESEFYKSVWN